MLEIIIVSGMVVTGLSLVVLQIIDWRYKKMNQEKALKLLEWFQSLTKEQQERIYSLALKVTDNKFFWRNRK